MKLRPSSMPCADRFHIAVVVEQAVAVDAFQPFAFDLFGGRDKAIGADDLQFLLIPQHQVIIVVVVAVQIAAAAGAFPYRTEGDLAQATQFAQDRRACFVVAAVEVDGFTVRRHPQPFAVRQRLFQLQTLFRQRDRRFAGEQPRFALARAIHMAAKTLRQILALV